MRPVPGPALSAALVWLAATSCDRTACEVWYPDGDGDGFGDPAPVEVCGDAPPGDLVANDRDCDDGDAAIHPDAPETCATVGVDDDCDGRVDADDDDARDADDLWADADGDGHGDPGAPLSRACPTPDAVPVADDCDDGDATVFPGAPERCDGRANDCDAPAAVDGVLATLGSGQTFDDLGDALAAAAPSDTVQICGAHAGVFVASAPVHLIGQGGREAATLSADDAGTTLTVPPGSTVTGLTLTQGRGDRGGGLALSAPGTLEVRDCTLQLNTAREGGGVYLPDGSVASFPGTAITANRAEQGGGVKAGRGAVLDLTDATVDGNRADVGGGITGLDLTITGGVVSGNAADDNSGPPHFTSGGGLLLLGTSTVTGTEIVDNFGDMAGGGISAADGVLALIDVRVHGNEGYLQGGGLHLLDITTTLEGTEIGPGNVTAAEGGGIYLARGSVAGGLVHGNSALQGGGVFGWEADLAEVEIRDNHATWDAAGIYLFGGTLRDATVADNDGGWTGGMFTDARYDYVHIFDTVFTGNVGGGVWINASDANQTLLERVEITDHTLDDVGAVGIDEGVVEIVDSAILRNTASGAAGAGIALFDGARVRVTTSDLGEGADDNAPADVEIVGGPVVHGYGVGASFDCGPTGCTPAP